MKREQKWKASWGKEQHVQRPGGEGGNACAILAEAREGQ